MLQPAILSPSPALLLRACFAISLIAADPEHAESAERSGVLTLLADVLCSIAPGSLALGGLITERFMASILSLLSPDIPAPLQLACLQVRLVVRGMFPGSLGT